MITQFCGIGEGAGGGYVIPGVNWSDNMLVTDRKF